ncbi:MAG: glutathione S-transferase N-terminal domain-containing protein [Gammaproteobacteria bacterium]|nr:glutathione S-transferase N-terminal domain-containing protein [Gammaproteobacteria bacterium]
MVETYQLFQYESCPFCYRVRQFLEATGIDLELKDTLLDVAASRELYEGGGRNSVPCLRIQRAGEVQWLYESLDIIDYLKSRFGV